MKSKYFIWASLLIFSISLLLPVSLDRDHFIEYYTADNPENLGYFYLLMGYMTAFELPIDFICWLGNFTLILSWIFYRFKLSFITSILSFLQMLIFGLDYIFKLNIIEFSDYDFPLFGYWFWLISSFLMLLYNYNRLKYT